MDVQLKIDGAFLLGITAIVIPIILTIISVSWKFSNKIIRELTCIAITVEMADEHNKETHGSIVNALNKQTEECGQHKNVLEDHSERIITLEAKSNGRTTQNFRPR